MKKILFMAMIAVAFMACGGDQNGATLPSKDKAAINKVTVEGTALIGQNAAAVDKALTAAGYTKVDDASLVSAPKRVQAKFNAPAATEEMAYFVYGIDPKVAMSENEDVAAFNKALAKGSIIMVAVAYVNDKMYQMASNTSIKCSKEDSRVYTDISDGLYKQIPAEALQSKWQGATTAKKYSKHDEFVADIAAAEDGITAQEIGYAVTNVTAAGAEGLYYQGMWMDPTAETKAAMEKEGYTPYANATVYIVDVNVVINQ